MEENSDIPENAKETDNLVQLEEEGGDELTAEMTSLLSENNPDPGEGGSSRNDSVEDPRPSENQRPSQPHPYHLKNKYTFRSDSVYSDVVPISAASHSSASKQSEPREKSGSLSSLKTKESKWKALKKKLGRLNSTPNPMPSSPSLEKANNSSAGGEEKETSENKRPAPVKSLHEKRSLFQRAKTLAILPVHRGSKDREDPPPKRVVEPPELFNVGGEMNLIPLELLIDINSVGMRK